MKNTWFFNNPFTSFATLVICVGISWMFGKPLTPETVWHTAGSLFISMAIWDAIIVCVDKLRKRVVPSL